MIHQYKLNGYNIVLDVNSGSVHCVDDVAYDIIQLFCEAKDNGQEPDRDSVRERILAKYHDREDVTPEDIEETMHDIDELEQQKKLFADDIWEPSAGILKERHTEVKALCLHVAHTCNLNCEYCFASQGRFHGERAIMSWETAKQAIDWLVANSGDHYNLEVDFFGGEPLLIWEVVKKTVAYARTLEEKHHKHFRFTLTTNGVGINDEVIDFTNKEMNNVVLSLDGRKEVHDHLRKFIDGRGSYDEIVPKFQKLVKARGDKEYYIRGTFTHNNVDFTEDLFHMADLGFDRLSIEPVVCAPDEPYALTEDDLPEIFRQYEILAKWLMANPKVLILDEPTRGVDVGAKSDIHTLMCQFAAKGMAVIMISSELPEIMGMSDRILIYHEGTLNGEISRQEILSGTVTQKHILSKEFGEK